MAKSYYLVKSEPYKYSFDQLVADGHAVWDGIRSFEARNNLRAMKKGDLVLYYHSNEGKEIVGVVEIVRPFYPNPDEPSDKFGLVDVVPVMPVKKPVTLAEMKATAKLKDMALIRQSRLSVCPVTDQEWAVVCKMAGIEA